MITAYLGGLLICDSPCSLTLLFHCCAVHRVIFVCQRHEHPPIQCAPHLLYSEKIKSVHQQGRWVLQDCANELHNVCISFAFHSCLMQCLPTGSFIPRLVAVSRTLPFTPTSSTRLTSTLLWCLSPTQPPATEEASQFPRRGRVGDSCTPFALPPAGGMQCKRHHLANTHMVMSHTR